VAGQRLARGRANLSGAIGSPLPTIFEYSVNCASCRRTVSAALRIWIPADMRRPRPIHLDLIAACILLAGLAGSAIIYFNAGDEGADTIGYEFAGGQSYAVSAHDSKAYRHELERFGGKAAVFADDLNRWFASCWSGKGLAGLIAALSVGGALVCFRMARSSGEERRLPPPSPDGS
jgi:hypothetical protein